MTAVPANQPDWRALGACLDDDLTVFFGPDGETDGQRDIREAAAKRVCARCPVVTECLDFALTRNVRLGVWAGMGEEERRSHRYSVMRRARRNGEAAA